MGKKTPILFFVFYILALLQASFLVYFSIFGITPNLILILVIFINIFENPTEKWGLFAAFMGGFFLDVFSSHQIGFNILIMVLVSASIKIILKNYVRLLFLKRI